MEMGEQGKRTIWVAKWRPRETEKSIGAPQKHWVDDIKEVVRRN